MSCRIIDFNIGRQAVGTSTSIPRGAAISFWKETDILPAANGLFAAERVWEDLAVMELKGLLKEPCPFDFGMPGFDLWMVFQFRGKLTLATEVFDRAQYACTRLGDLPIRSTLAGSRVWSVLLGIADRDLVHIRNEWPSLRYRQADSQNAVKGIFKQTLGYRQEEVFGQIRNVTDEPYSTPIKIRYHLAQLLRLYHEDFAASARSVDLDNVVLYHRAVDYIKKHYMEPGLDREAIADALHVAVRTLNRAFLGRPFNVIGTIRLTRLYRARELLQTTSQTVEEIAFTLHFAHNSHLTRAYTKVFGYSPLDERKRIKREKL